VSFDHENMAVQGLFPGLVTTQSVANLGHFKLEVVIVAPEGGPPGVADTTRITPPRRKEKDKYTVSIRVSYKTRIWYYQSEVDTWMATIVARLVGKQLNKPVDPEIVVKSVKVTPEEIDVKVTKK